MFHISNHNPIEAQFKPRLTLQPAACSPPRGPFVHSCPTQSPEDPRVEHIKTFATAFSLFILLLMASFEQAPVLLAEDDEDFIALLKDAMSLAGWRVPLEVLHDGQEVIDYFTRPAKSSFPALLLLDLQLPRIAGIEVLRWLRQNPETRALPVIILTSCSSASAVFQAYDCGANSYILKPGALTELIEKLLALRNYLEICETPA
jgi:two-component system, response regulator